MPTPIAELVGHRVSVIVTLGDTSVAIAVKKSGTTIPIVISVGTIQSKTAQ